MPRFVTLIVAATLIAAVLAACTVSGEPPPPQEFDYEFNASLGYPPSSRGTVSLPANQDVLIRVASGNVGSDPLRLLVFEVEAVEGTLIEVRSATGQVLGASRSEHYFASSVAEAGAPLAARAEPMATTRTRSDRVARDAASVVEALSINVQWACAGPCVAIRPPAGASRDYVVRVRTTSTQSASFFAYRFTEQDQNEPNNNAADATTIPGTTSAAGRTVIGAIERLFDEDYYEVGPSGWGTNTVDVQLTAPVADAYLNVYLEFLEDGYILYPDDPPVSASPGERFVVRAHDSGVARAGPATDSRYVLFLDAVN